MSHHDSPSPHSLVADAIAAIAEGATVVVVDCTGHAALAVAADHVDARAIAALRRRAGGWVFLALPPQRCAELGLEPRSRRPRPGAVDLSPEDLETTQTIDAATGIASGISAADQARTIRIAADPAATRDALVSPGHVQPLCVAAAGVRIRPARAEAAVDLSGLAGLTPAAVLAEIVDDDGHPADAAQIAETARAHGLVTVTVEDVLAHRRRHEPVVERVTSTVLPTSAGEFVAVGYRSLVDGSEHIAMVKGDVSGVDDVLLHLHERCLVGDVFRSLSCGCAHTLHAALAHIQRERRGVLVYRARRSNGTGPVGRLHEHVEPATGSAVDPHEYEIAAGIVRDLGLATPRLLTNDPREASCLEQFGVAVRTLVAPR